MRTKFFSQLNSRSFSALYDEVNLHSVVRRSLNFILLGNILGTMCGIVCGGSTAVTVSFAGQLGANDLHYGLLAAIPAAATILQIPFSMAINRTKQCKHYLLTFGLFSRMLWLLVGLIPLIIPVEPDKLRLWVFIFLLGLYACGSQAINPAWLTLMSNLCPDQIRGRWISVRESLLAFVSLSCGVLFAMLLDALPETKRYIIVFSIGGLAGVADMLCFIPCKEIHNEAHPQLAFRTVFREISKNRQFMMLLLMWTGWSFAINIFFVYSTPYSMNVMGLNHTQIMIFGTASAAVMNIIMMPIWGNVTTRIGTRKVMLIGSFGASFVPLAYLLAKSGSVLPTFLNYAVGHFFYSACNLTATSLQLSTAPDRIRASYVAVFAVVTSLAGTMLGSLIGGGFLELCAANEWFYYSIDRYQALALISVGLRLSVALFIVPHLANHF